MNLTLLEERLMRAIEALGDNAYGVSIRDCIGAVAGIKPSLNGLYEGLERLEKRELVASLLGEATPERGGRRKRMYRLSGSGVLALRQREAEQMKFTASWGRAG